MTSHSDLRRARLAFDYRVLKTMEQSSQLIEVQAFASQHDLKKRRRPICNTTGGGSAGYYLVHYHVKSLVGPGEYLTGFDVVFDLMSKKTYPDERAHNTINAGGITATCVSRPMAWSPHFLGSSGTICLGSIWRGAKHTLLAHVIIHVARLLNWDEPIDAEYGGWNPSAIKWWKKKLGSEPITPELRYPILPADITHNLLANTSSVDGRISVANPSAGGFKILKVVNSPAAPSVFKTRPTGILNI